MSLDRKDVKVYFDPGMHKGLAILAGHDGMGLAEWIESVVCTEITRRVHDAQCISEETRGLGIVRDQPELPGMPKKARR